MTVDIQRIGSTRDQLGEGPLWDSRNGLFYWLDSMAGTIHCYDPGDDTVRDWTLPCQKIGSLALRSDGGGLLALTDGFYGFDFSTGTLDPIVLPESGNSHVRFNDGKVDRQGRFVAGTVVRPSSDKALGMLYRLSANGTLEVLETDLHISNGPCFSPDGHQFYFTDSLQKKVWAYDYFEDARPPMNRRVIFETANLDTLPDGATVDADGCLWIALVMIGKVCRITPDGKIDRLLEMPVPHPTSVNFGGTNMDTLFVTSVSASETGRFRTTDPLSGGLFAVTGLGIQGIAEPRFGAVER